MMPVYEADGLVTAGAQAHSTSWHKRLSLAGLCGLLGIAGVLHFAVPGPFRRIVPAPLRRHADAIVALSGVCELACATLLASPPRRRLGASLTAGLFAAVFPANVQMALDLCRAEPPAPALLRVGALLRLPLQVPLMLWALSLRPDRTRTP